MQATPIRAEPIAGSLPPLLGTGWAREDVWVEDSAGKHGDFAVGASYSARYTYTLPCGTRRLCADIDQYVENLTLLNDVDDEPEYGVMEHTEVREERRTNHPGDDDGEWQEVQSLETSYEPHAYIYDLLSDAEDAAKRLALKDMRGSLYASPRF